MRSLRNAAGLSKSKGCEMWSGEGSPSQGNMPQSSRSHSERAVAELFFSPVILFQGRNSSHSRYLE